MKSDAEDKISMLDAADFEVSPQIVVYKWAGAI